MMTRRRLALMTFVAGIVALAATPWALAERSIERYMFTQLSQQLMLGEANSASGAVAFLPFPRIVANDVKMSSADGVISARIPRLRADIRLLPLLTGRIEFEQLSLSAPQIDVRLPAEQHDPLQLVSSHLLAQLPDFPRIVISNNGAIFLRRDQRIVSSVRDVNLDIAEHTSGEAVQASGSLLWRGEKLQIAMASNSQARNTLPMLSIKSDLITLDFASARSVPQIAGQPPTLDGQVQIASKSISRLGAWLASGSPVLLRLGNTAVSGRMRISEAGAQVSSAVVTIGTDVLDGALDWRKRDDRWRLTGTLAGKNLDIGRPLAGVDVNRVALPELATTSQIDVDDLFVHDIDLRMSLQRVRLPGIILSDVACQIMATEQRLDLSVTNAGLYGGVLRGRGSLSRASSGIDVRTQMSAERVDLAQLSQDMFEARRITGLGALQQSLETSGRTPAELVTNAQGRFAVSARNGEFLGTNLNDAMRRIERQPLSAARDWRGGRTNFEQLAVAGVISGGVMEVNEARGNGPAFRLAMDGQISLLERVFRLSGQVQSTNGVTSIPFEVVGPLLEPFVQINARAFLERSGAAAPLLLQRAD